MRRRSRYRPRAASGPSCIVRCAREAAASKSRRGEGAAENQSEARKHGSIKHQSGLSIHGEWKLDRSSLTHFITAAGLSVETVKHTPRSHLRTLAVFSSRARQPCAPADDRHLSPSLSLPRSLSKLGAESGNCPTLKVRGAAPRRPCRRGADRPHVRGRREMQTPKTRSYPITMVRHRGSPTRGGFVAARTFSDAQRVGAHLRDAALRGDELATRRWLGAGDVSAADGDGTTSLHKACQYGRAAITQTLCAAGADPNAIGLSGRTPLHEACQFGAETCVRELLLAGAAQLADDAGMTPRDWADRNGHEVIVDMIRDAPAQLGDCTPSARSPPEPEPEPEMCLQPAEGRSTWTAGSGWNAQPPFAVKYSSPIGLERKLMEAQHLTDIISSGGVGAGARASDEKHKRATATGGGRPLTTLSPHAEASFLRQAEARAEGETAAKTACVAQTHPNETASAEHHRIVVAAAARTSSDGGTAATAAAGRTSVQEAMVAPPPLAAPPLLSPITTGGGGWQYGSPASPPPVDNLDDTDTDPMATIRRLARQYRTKHPSPTATTSEPAATIADTATFSTGGSGRDAILRLAERSTPTAHEY